MAGGGGGIEGVGFEEGEGLTRIEVVVGNGIRVRVGKGFDQGTPIRVMEVVTRC